MPAKQELGADTDHNWTKRIPIGLRVREREPPQHLNQILNQTAPYSEGQHSDQASLVTAADQPSIWG